MWGYQSTSLHSFSCPGGFTDIRTLVLVFQMPSSSATANTLWLQDLWLPCVHLNISVHMILYKVNRGAAEGPGTTADQH